MIMKFKKIYLIFFMFLATFTTNYCKNSPEDPDGSSTDGTNNGVIVFSSDRDGNHEIYIMAEDGSGQTRLTNHESTDMFPIWTPNGEKISFISGRDGGFGIYTMNPDGSNLQRIGQGLRHSWLPDGSQLVAEANDGSTWGLYLMNSDGSERRKLIEAEYSMSHPSWAPTGDKIAFTVTDNGQDIYTADIDGSNLTRLTDNGFSFSPSWSPDGSLIAYNSGGNNLGIWLMNSDGSNQRRLSSLISRDEFPSWSPDGGKIVFECDLYNNQEDIFILNADGKNLVRLTNNNYNDLGPSWKPVQ